MIFKFLQSSKALPLPIKYYKGPLNIEQIKMKMLFLKKGRGPPNLLPGLCGISAELMSPQK